MAPATIETKLAIVDVVGTMTVVAAAAQPHLVFHRLPMTGFTLCIAMCTVEGKIGLRVVIETPLRPVDRRVAERAVVGEAVSVRIVWPVTRHAVRWCVPELLCFVTGRTFGVVVFAQQGEASQAMVEEDVFGPGRFIVAILAGRSLGTIVGIVVFVAQSAAAWRLSVKDRFDMTSCAFDTGVGTAERVVRVDVVIECQLRPLGRHVARVTTFAKMPLMVVIIIVAGETGGAELIGKRIVAMAVSADQRRVLAGQAE
jgi:hypothetical protein